MLVEGRRRHFNYQPTNATPLDVASLLPAHSVADFNFYSLPVPFAAEQDTQAADTQLASPSIFSHILTNLPFKLTPEYEKAILTRTERLHHLNERMSALPADALAKVKSDISKAFKSWLVANGEIQSLTDLLNIQPPPKM